MIQVVRQWLKICWIAATRVYLERYTYQASALSFSTLLALVPLLSVALSVVALFPIFTRFVNLARNYILANFIPASSSTIEFYLENFTQQATHLPTLGVVFLFIVTGVLIVTIEHTFNQIWQAPDSKKKYALWLLYYIVLLLSPLLIGLSVFVSYYVFSLHWLSGTIGALGIGKPLFSCLPVVINTFIFSTLYIVIPRNRVKWRDGISGGFIAAILFELSKFLFAFYLKKFSTYELIYGALAIIPIFLMWLYISWLIILYGAFVTHTHYQQRSLLQKKSSR
jgi:membrane protein